MSLYVGGLSPHVRPDELEHVFRRFGRCYFQLKDGYGFVVYEVTANAERALRALRGKNVCGEHISLSWSNKQPRPFQRPTRGPRFDLPYHRRMFREEDDDARMRGSQDRRDFSVGIRLPAYNHGGTQVDGADKESGHTHADADNVRGNKGVSLTNELIDEDTAELNPLEHDRWGEPIGDALPSHGAGNGSDFDRYEPYHGYNRRDEKENNLRANSGSSPNRGLHGKGQKEHFIEEADRNFDKSKPLTCYNCGQVGHIKRQCPEGDSRRERFSKFDQIRDEASFRDREGRLKKFQANSWGRPSTSRDPFVARRRPWDRKELHSVKGAKSIKSRSPPERMEKQRSKRLSESPTKKRTKKHYRSKKTEKRRRTKMSDTSSISSDSSKSSSMRSQSKSVSGTKSHSASRSASSRSRPMSSRSRSISVSSYAKSKSSRSRSRSISRSRSRSIPQMSPSLSVSLGQKSSSSLKNMKRDVSITSSPMENSEHMEIPESKHFSKMNNSELKALKDETTSSALGVKNLYSKEYSGKTDDSAHKSALKVVYNERDACDLLNGTATASENCLERGTFQEPHSMKSDAQIANGSMRISTGEMLSALRHYGLVSREEDEPDVSVEEYFGSARLWPWEMIYYRRLKKGPITTENYAKRIQQNKEFGIVDKYIRSSSGWGEM